MNNNTQFKVTGQTRSFENGTKAGHPVTRHFGEHYKAIAFAESIDNSRITEVPVAPIELPGKCPACSLALGHPGAHVEVKRQAQSIPSKAGVVAALNHLGFYQHEGPFPPSLKTVKPAPAFTAEELSFAEYLVADTDFGGAWNDAAQIEMHTA